jgi:HD superfamily phosphohydrolase
MGILPLPSSPHERRKIIGRPIAIGDTIAIRTYVLGRSGHRGDGSVAKQTHEFRDPIHTFIRVRKSERDRIIDSPPVQRLRNIHQLALTYLIYPGATHRRFEHSLGVLELADRVFRTITDPENRVTGLSDEIGDFLFGATDSQRAERENWRGVLRAAALCHDIGHFPFSHGGESLGPQGPDSARWKHERFTLNLIRSNHLGPSLVDLAPNAIERTARIAVGQKEFVEANGRRADLSTLEAILSEIIVGDAFGVDRMDYLLRDSLHVGVAYGHFDHFRLIDTLRVVPEPPGDETAVDDSLREPVLGLDEGGLQSAEQFLLARHFMYTQVYFHPVRRAFDGHLVDFLKGWLKGGVFPRDVDAHLRLDDSRVLTAMMDAAGNSRKPGHEPARRILERRHFKVVWSRNARDIRNPNAAQLIYKALCEEPAFGPELVRVEIYKKDPKDDKNRGVDFPVHQSDGNTVWASAISKVVEQLPPVAFDYVFVAPEIRDKAREWLAKHKDDILQEMPKEEER